MSLLRLFVYWEGRRQRDLTGNTTVDLEGDPDHGWLSPTKTRNLLAYPRTGQTSTSTRLELEPAERYRKWECPHCGTFTVVPVIVGMPTFEAWDAAKDGHLIGQGCIVYGDEPEYAVACTTCDCFGELIRDRTICQVARPRAFADDLVLFDIHLEEQDPTPPAMRTPTQ